MIDYYINCLQPYHNAYDCATIDGLGRSKPLLTTTGTAISVMAPSDQTAPVLAVVMGVSGSGKSSLAGALAEQLGFTYLDGDDYHSEEARQRMANGQPLTDDMREPWMASILQHLEQLHAQGTSCTLAISGLRRAHREQLRRSPYQVVFLFLDGDRELILQRMRQRRDHFMPPDLLDSQFASLERPVDEADIITLDPTLPLAELTRIAARKLRL